MCNLVLAGRQRGPLGVVVYHHLGDLLHAARHAMSHYFPLDLSEPFLQNSSLGTPYQKWAYFTSEDFRKVDECLRRLMVVSFHYYADTHHPFTAGRVVHTKDAAHWFQAVATRYTCCTVDDGVPTLTLSAVNFEGWVEPGGTDFLNVWNRAPWERGDRELPSIVTTRVVPIGDRGVIQSLSREGLDRLAELRRTHETFGAGLRAALTMDDVTSPHEGTLSDYWIGVVTTPGVPARKTPGVSSE